MALCKASFSYLLLLMLALCALSATRKRTVRTCEFWYRYRSTTEKIFLNPSNPFNAKEVSLPPIFHDNVSLHSSQSPQLNDNTDININNPPVTNISGLSNPVNIPNTDNKSNMQNIGTKKSNDNLFLSSTPSLVYRETLSEIKCKEYDKQISRALGLALIETFKSLFGNDTKDLEDGEGLCGTARSVVVGGTPTIPGEFPHMVSLGKQLVNGDFSHFCGGTLISPNWVLTAAHCTYGPSGNPNVARVGLNNLNDTTGQTLHIKRIIRHPMYKPPPMYGDIALVELNENITFSEKIRPACLYVNNGIDPLEAWVTGWGTNEFGNIELTNELQKANLTIIDNVECSKRLNGSLQVPRGIHPNMICAGDPQNHWSKDTCQGDSGGPLQVSHPKNLCVFQIVGVTSFGNGCAFLGTPGVYTRVSHFLNWIEEIVWLK